MNPEEARKALEGVNAVDRQLAERLKRFPLWQHAAKGALLALLIGAVTISMQAQFLASIAVIAIVVLIVRSERKRNGMFVNSVGRGRTMVITVVFLGVVLALAAAAINMRQDDFPLYDKAMLAAIAGLSGIVYSVVRTRAHRTELLKGRS